MTQLDPFQTYQQDPTPDNLFSAVKDLRPTVDFTLKSLGAERDPYMRSRADLVTADAIKSFDPTKGAQIQTHVSNQLKRLYRENRARRSPIPVADRMQLDKFSVQRATEELEEELNREPTALEIAERARLSLRRLEKVRAHSIPIGTEGGGAEMGIEQANVSETDWDQEAVDYVYRDSDRIDQKLLEYKLGLYGAPKLSAGEIAVKLKLQPYQVTRRSMRISKRINEILANLREVAG